MVSPAGRKAPVYTGLNLGLLSSQGSVSVPGAGAGLSNQCGGPVGCSIPSPPLFWDWGGVQDSTRLLGRVGVVG